MKSVCWILTTLVLLTTLGCATDTASTEAEYSLTDIQNAVFSVMKVGLTQEDARNFVSMPFRANLRNGKIEKPKPEDQVRAVAHFNTVGNEKPYSLDVWVKLEKNKDGVWSGNKRDLDLAQKLSKQILDYLKKGRDKNLIDDFRPF